jgi:hypothetical protein
MSFNAKIIQILIASPSNVPDEREAVVEAIYSWNATHAAKTRRVLLPVRWETHGTPVQGLPPQDLLNFQIVKDSDMLIGVFWNRLGSPTTRYVSGTAEEIDKMSRAGRPAMLYFSKKSLPQSFDDEQWKALKEFRNNIRRTGMQAEFDGLQDLKEQIIRHLYKEITERPALIGEALLEAGTSISDSSYDLPRFFDSSSREIYVIGQNLRSVLSDSRVLPHFHKLLSKNRKLELRMIISSPGSIDHVHQDASRHYAQTIREHKMFCRGLDEECRRRVTIRAHAGATSLSALIRDPGNDDRGVMVFTPKWATDQDPGNRIFCVVRKSENPVIFARLFGHLSMMLLGKDLNSIATED